jgi:hypothetical protein
LTNANLPKVIITEILFKYIKSQNFISVENGNEICKNDDNIDISRTQLSHNFTYSHPYSNSISFDNNFCVTNFDGGDNQKSILYKFNERKIIIDKRREDEVKNLIHPVIRINNDTLLIMIIKTNGTISFPSNLIHYSNSNNNLHIILAYEHDWNLYYYNIDVKSKKLITNNNGEFKVRFNNLYTFIVFFYFDQNTDIKERFN